jgi:uncharacterized protein
MNTIEMCRCTAFEGSRRIASGEFAEVARAAKAAIDRGGAEPILIFDDSTAKVIEVDFRGSADDVRQRLRQRAESEAVTSATADAEPEGSRRPGRPKLGVIGREVTLLPRHWDWLNGQPGGASVALRKLVDEARRANEDMDRKRKARDTAYRFMAAMAGDHPGFEEALRALFAGDAERFQVLIKAWPADIRDHTGKLAAAAF